MDLGWIIAFALMAFWFWSTRCKGWSSHQWTRWKMSPDGIFQTKECVKCGLTKERIV